MFTSFFRLPISNYGRNGKESKKLNYFFLVHFEKMYCPVT